MLLIKKKTTRTKREKRAVILYHARQYQRMPRVTVLIRIGCTIQEIIRPMIFDPLYILPYIVKYVQM